jgi:hypothetical protein
MGVLQGLVSHGGYLYAAWKGEPDDDRIFYSRWNGSGKWAPASPMASGTVGGNTSAGPSLGVFGGSLYAAWKGEWSDPRLFFAKYNGSNWENQKQIPNAYSDVGPALCSFNSTQLIAAWKNFDQNLYFAVYDGSWHAPSQIAGVASSVGPSLATYGGKLYAVWKGEGSDESLWYAYYDGTKWSGQKPGTSQTQIPSVGSSMGAAIAEFNGKLYAVWKGEGSDESLWYAYYDGTKWSGQKPGTSQTQIPGIGIGSSMGAAIAEFNGKLYAMWKGKDSDVSLYNANFDGTKWSAQANDIPGNTGPDTDTTLLQAPAGGYANYLLADSKGATLTGTTVTIIVVDDIVPDNAGAYSFQINCNGPAQPSGAQTFGWQQYGFRIARSQLFFWVNTFQNDTTNGKQFIDWDSRPPRLPANKGVVPLANNRLPSGSQLTTTLANDGDGKVTGVTFSVALPDGTAVNSGLVTLLSLPPAVPGNLLSILNLQVILVAENIHDNGTSDTINFSGGKGIFHCYETNNLTATVSQRESEEGSNVKYSSLPASYPNGEFYQFFGVPSV